MPPESNELGRCVTARLRSTDCDRLSVDAAEGIGVIAVLETMGDGNRLPDVDEADDDEDDEDEEDK